MKESAFTILFYQNDGKTMRTLTWFHNTRDLAVARITALLAEDPDLIIDEDLVVKPGGRQLVTFTLKGRS